MQTVTTILKNTEPQIRINPLLQNLRKLQRYRDRLTSNSGTLTLLRNAVPHPRTLKDLIANPLGIRLETIYKLIANGQITANLSVAKLSLDAEVRYA